MRLLLSRCGFLSNGGARRRTRQNRRLQKRHLVHLKSDIEHARFQFRLTLIRNPVFAPIVDDMVGVLEIFPVAIGGT